MASLPPCPYEGCTSDSDHHWHNNSPEPQRCGGITALCQDIEPEHRCYSRPLRIAQEDKDDEDE